MVEAKQISAFHSKQHEGKNVNGINSFDAKHTWIKLSKFKQRKLNVCTSHWNRKRLIPNQTGSKRYHKQSNDFREKSIKTIKRLKHNLLTKNYLRSSLRRLSMVCRWSRTDSMFAIALGCSWSFLLTPVPCCVDITEEVIPAPWLLSIDAFAELWSALLLLAWCEVLPENFKEKIKANVCQAFDQPDNTTLYCCPYPRYHDVKINWNWEVLVRGKPPSQKS